MTGIVKPVFPRLQRGHPMAQSLRGAWLFYEGSGLNVQDVGPFNIYGVYNGGSSGDEWTNGKWGRAFDFSSSDSELLDCIETGVDANGDPIDPIGGMPGATILAIVRVTADSNRKFILHETRSLNNTRLRLEVTASETVTFGVRSDTEGQQTLTSSTVLGSDWHVIWAVASIADDEMRLFIDGVEESGSPASVTFSNSSTFSSYTENNLKIGADGNEANFFNGQIAVIKLWGEAFTEQKLRQMAIDPFVEFRQRISPIWSPSEETGMLNRFGSMRGGISSGRYGTPLTGGMRQ